MQDGLGACPLAFSGAAFAAACVVASGIDGGVGRAVDFRQGDEHGGFDRTKPAARSAPLAQRLEFQGVCRDIGHVECGKGGHGGGAVVIGGATDKAEAGERNHRIHAAREIGVDGGATVEASGKGGQDGQPLCFEGADDAVVMRGVRGEDVGAQHQKAHGRHGAFGAGNGGNIGGDAGGKVGMIQAHIGVIDGGLGRDRFPFALGRIARDEVADHLFDIVVGPAEPVLHRQEPCPQVLRLAGKEFQDFRQAAQHLHLLLARRSRRRVGPAQFLQELHGRRGGLAHVQITHAGKLDDGGVGDQADEGIGAGAGVLQLGQDGADVFFDEQKVRHDEIGALDGGAGGGKGGGVLGPFGGGVDRNLDPRKIAGKAGGHAGGGACGMGIERDDDEAIDAGILGRALGGRGRRHGAMAVIAHNGPLPRKGFRR